MSSINNNIASVNKMEKILHSNLMNLKNCLEPISLDQFVISTLEALMIIEREDYLAKLKETNSHRQDKIFDKANGHYTRSFKSLSRNSLIINVPRTRAGNFKPFVLEFLKYNQEQINDLVLTLYRKGLTTRDVSDILKDFFGEEISYSQVSNLAERFNALRLDWQSSPLEEYYKVIFCDCIYITLRRGDSYSKEAVHIAYGVRNDNKRELLSLSVNPCESVSSWGECFAQIKARGVNQVDLIVADGLKSLENEVHKHFKVAKFQKCVVHKMRNILNKTRPRDKKELADDLSKVFDNFDRYTGKENIFAEEDNNKTNIVLEETKTNNSKKNIKEFAFKKVECFIHKWQDRYPNISSFFTKDELEYYFTYIDFNPEVRRMIYSTNSIESLNKKIRKATKNKQSFEKEDRLLDYIFIVIKDFEYNNWMKYPVSLYNKF